MFSNTITQAKAHHASKRWLDCVIRVEKPPCADDLAQLKKAGFVRRSIVGTIITGKIRVRDADKLGELSFVLSIDGGDKGGPKQKLSGVLK